MARKRNPLEKITDLPARQAKYPPIAAALRALYGPLDWRRHQDGMDELVSCILSQSTTDANRDRAFARLKAHYANWDAVRFADLDELIEVLRPAGLAKQKAPRIQAALTVIYDTVGDYNIDFLADMPLAAAKDWLVSLKGIGPKTAAIVLCFAYDLPAFPVDTHVFRVGKRIGFLPAKISANNAHPVMEAIAPPSDYYQFHIHMIQHGRDTCQARRPACQRCQISAHCDYFAASGGAEA